MHDLHQVCELFSVALILLGCVSGPENAVENALHYAKVVQTRFEVVNFDKLILHQSSTNISQIFIDGVKTSKFLK